MWVEVLVRPTVLLALALMGIIIMMILPVPSIILDIGLALSFALAVLIFTVTLFIERPLDFSAFPTVLLATLMLRLSLNISSTKLIIGEGHTGTDAAGDVIEGFANFIMGGSIFLGLVVFCVLLIVNFLVITKGAARMAEVGARFALDAMPGKQMAIDSDLAAGAIDHTEAKARREREQQETTFFGSLDGASKFVKGDAIAGLLITILNLVMGLVMGTVIHDMPVSTAFETYAILTVGDGLVTQIPAVIISIAAALLLARGGASGSTDLALTAQLGRHPAALGTVCLLLGLFAFLPGLPFGPFIVGSVILGLSAVFIQRNKIDGRKQADLPEPHQTQSPVSAMGDVLDVDDIHVEFAPDLVSMVLDPGTGLDARITNMRLHVAKTFGLILSEIRLTDDHTIPPGYYVIRLQGVEVVRARIYPEEVLALHHGGIDLLPVGKDVREPVYNAPARWIASDAQDAMALSGITVVTPAEVLATHLLEVIKRNLGRLLSLKSLRRILDEMTRLSDPIRAEANRRLLDEMIPDHVSIDMLHAVLRLLLEEQVSIRNLPLILEATAEGRRQSSTAGSICDHVRARLGFQLVAELRREDGSIPLLQLASEWEDVFATYQIDGERGAVDIALPPEVFNRLASAVSDQVNAAVDRGIFPALVTSTQRRRFLRTVLKARGISNPVLSFEEIGLEARPSLVGVVAA
ncbi:flagellar biosynthesis protein FlhA [Seohaeicola saemankumensis]|uniref:flagellar biosynthesis protein FlhA n=1 Tax=Seohaeicola saemankumensis TaxID=481181 RepID=UPI001E3ABA99|nr:flagellar biosynthesis protein FlhA [Seohaeicola saemankumensis]MCD1625034.1 flagellar biosynthesis protein FlhA [Seohaeicola saemankumensis]